MQILKAKTPRAGDLKKLKALQTMSNELVKKARDAEIQAERYGNLRHVDVSDLSFADQRIFKSITGVYRLERKAEKHYPDQFVIGYGVARIQRVLTQTVKHDHFDSNLAKIIAQFASSSLHVLIQPTAIIFKDRKNDWITKHRRVIVSSQQTKAKSQEALREAMQTFPILTQVDDLRKIIRKFAFKTSAPMPTALTRMPHALVEDMEIESRKRGLRKRKLSVDDMGGKAKRRKTVPCEICGIRRIAINKWQEHFESKGHFRSVFHACPIAD